MSGGQACAIILQIKKEIKMEKAVEVVILLVFLKSITVGSSFSFNLWIKYGKEYSDWYFDYENRKFPKEK